MNEAIMEETLTLEHIEGLDKAALESLKREIEATLKALPSLRSLGLSLTAGSTRWRWDNDIVVQRMKLIMAVADINIKLGLSAEPRASKFSLEWQYTQWLHGGATRGK